MKILKCRKKTQIKIMEKINVYSNKIKGFFAVQFFKELNNLKKFSALQSQGYENILYISLIFFSLCDTIIFYFGMCKLIFTGRLSSGINIISFAQNLKQTRICR